jgi:carbamoyltransferase
MKLHIPVEPGDGGASIGAAFAGYYARAEKPARAHGYSIYQGGTGNDIEPMLAKIDVEHSREYQKMGAVKDERHWQWKRTPEAASAAAEAVAEGKVVGLFQGRFELGPRALGNRSILFRPDRVDVAERVSREIKDRAPYRPYALSMMAEEASELLELEGLEASRPLHWMQLAVPARDPASLRAGVHTDGTTRPQLVAKKENPFFHSLLSEVKTRTGRGTVVNTSMNESGYPLVGSAEEALLLFARTSLDILVIDDLVIRKV